MVKINFDIVDDNGVLTIVRNKRNTSRNSNCSRVQTQSIKVQCFDAKEIDQIMQLQRVNAQRKQKRRWASQYWRRLAKV